MSPRLHPPDDRLRAFADEALDPEEAVALALHLDDCAPCRRRLEAIDPLGPMIARDAPSEPPAAWVERAVRLALRPPPPWAPAVGAASLLLGGLVLVGLGAPASLGHDLGALGSALAAVVEVVHLPGSWLLPLWLGTSLLLVGLLVAAWRRWPSELESAP